MEYLILAAVTVVLVARLGLDHFSRGRIRAAAEARGWKEVKVSAPSFAPGWVLGRRPPLFSVSYTDDRGLQHQRYCVHDRFVGILWQDATP